MREVSYQELRSGAIEIGGKEVRTSSLSSYRKALKIAKELKEWIEKGSFDLVRPAGSFPTEQAQKTLEVRSREEV